jgi:hypothetical protein
LFLNKQASRRRRSRILWFFFTTSKNNSGGRRGAPLQGLCSPVPPSNTFTRLAS